MCKKEFSDEIARDILQKYYPVHAIERKLVKTVHRAGHDNNQIDTIIYSLRGSPAKGALMISVFYNKVMAIRVFDCYGKIISKLPKYLDYDVIL